MWGRGEGEGAGRTRRKVQRRRRASSPSRHAALYAAGLTASRRGTVKLWPLSDSFGMPVGEGVCPRVCVRASVVAFLMRVLSVTGCVYFTCFLSCAIHRPRPLSTSTPRSRSRAWCALACELTSDPIFDYRRKGEERRAKDGGGLHERRHINPPPRPMDALPTPSHLLLSNLGQLRKNCTHCSGAYVYDGMPRACFIPPPPIAVSWAPTPVPASPPCSFEGGGVRECKGGGASAHAVREDAYPVTHRDERRR